MHSKSYDGIIGTVKASKSLSAMNHNGVFSPDGKEIWTALATEPAKVHVYDVDLTTLMKEIPVGSLPTEVTPIKDRGQYAFVTNSGSGNVTVIDVATRHPPVSCQRMKTCF